MLYLLKLINDYLNMIESLFYTNKIICKSSEIYKIGDLTKYRFEEVKSKLITTKIEIVKEDRNFFYVQFTDKSTEFLMCYRSSGRFKRIVYEYWRDLDIKFQNNQIIQSNYLLERI